MNTSQTTPENTALNDTDSPATTSTSSSAKGKKKALASNTFYLYLLVFSGYFFSLITVPYQTRVLGPEIYGKIGWAFAVMSYFSLFVEFGFLLSGTQEIAENREDKNHIEKIVGAVTLNKLFLSLIGAVVLLAITPFSPTLSQDFWFYFLCYISCIIPSFMLDFFYRGIEQMRSITVRTVAIKAFFTGGIFLFLHSPADYWIVPVLHIIGGGLAVFFAYHHMTRKLHYRIVFPDLKFTFRLLKNSVWFFVSRIASSLYSSTNIFVVGLIYQAASVTTGIFTAATNLLNIMRQLCGPISDSMYPYMIRNKDFRLLRKLLWLLMPPILLGSAVVAYFATQICSILFGSEYAAAGEILRWMMPIFAITLPQYLLGFPTLSALGGAKAANTSVVVASVFHMVALAGLFVLGWLNTVNIVILTFITESIVLLYRIIAVYFYWKRYNSPQSKQ